MTDEENPMVDVRLSRIVIRDGSDNQWIFLTERGGHRGFPIVIGSSEAHEIHRVLTKVAPGRPLTHQLAFDSIRALGAEIKHIEIVDLRKNTFYAHLVIGSQEGDDTQVLDARPSDALALGLRAGCPIRVAESLLEEVRSDTNGPDELSDTPPPDEPSD